MKYNLLNCLTHTTLQITYIDNIKTFTVTTFNYVCERSRGSTGIKVNDIYNLHINSLFTLKRVLHFY